MFEWQERELESGSTELIEANKSLVILIDGQDSLISVMRDKEPLMANIERILHSAALLNIETVASEQYPEKLGGTRQGWKEYIKEIYPKTSFSVQRQVDIWKKILEYTECQVIICGIETHVCVLQSALDIVAEIPNQVYVVVDAVSSRTVQNRSFAFRRLERSGVKLVTTEMLLFEWLRDCNHEAFKSISSLIK